jgi:hypothetical protein
LPFIPETLIGDAFITETLNSALMTHLLQKRSIHHRRCYVLKHSIQHWRRYIADFFNSTLATLNCYNAQFNIGDTFIVETLNSALATLLLLKRSIQLRAVTK